MSARPPRRNNNRQNTFWWFMIAGVLLLTLCLGLPQFHYTAALMIAVILRYKDEPAGAVPFSCLASVAPSAPIKDAA